MVKSIQGLYMGHQSEMNAEIYFSYCIRAFISPCPKSSILSPYLIETIVSITFYNLGRLKNTKFLTVSADFYDKKMFKVRSLLFRIWGVLKKNIAFLFFFFRNTVQLNFNILVYKLPTIDNSYERLSKNLFRLINLVIFFSPKIRN